jgi:hypothetical protein
LLSDRLFHRRPSCRPAVLDSFSVTLKNIGLTFYNMERRCLSRVNPVSVSLDQA